MPHLRFRRMTAGEPPLRDIARRPIVIMRSPHTRGLGTPMQPEGAGCGSLLGLTLPNRPLRTPICGRETALPRRLRYGIRKPGGKVRAC